MKSRRLTIFCVAMIALVGTPRAWQEVENLLAGVRHKAQVKFWSMVLPAADDRSAQPETIAAARSFQVSSPEVAANCPLESGKSWGNQVAGNSQTNRRPSPASLQPQAKAQRSPAAAPASHAALTAKALKGRRGDSSLEHLLDAASLTENQVLGFVESHKSSLPKPGAVAALPKPPAGNGDTFRYVLIPNASAIVPTLIEKENIVQLKLLKKSFDDNKALRQKSRFPLSRSAAAFPSS